MINIIISAIILCVVGLACHYIYKEKKKGKKCIGCSCSGCTSSKSACNCDNAKAE